MHSNPTTLTLAIKKAPYAARLYIRGTSFTAGVSAGGVVLGEGDYLRAYKHTYIHTYVRTYIHTYIHTYIPTYVRTYVRTYMDDV